MACKHKPRDPRLLIATGHGRYCTFDRIQRCRKCGVRIEMAHKTLYKLLLAVIALSNLFWCYLYLCYLGFRFLPTIPVTIVVGLALWTWHLSGGCMTWKAIELGKTQDDGGRETQEHREALLQREQQTSEAVDDLEGHTENATCKTAFYQLSLSHSMNETNKLKKFFRTHEIGICVVVVLLAYYIMIPVISRMAPPFHIFHLRAENVKEISISQSDENNSILSIYTINNPEEIEEMVEKLNDIHFYFWVLYMPSDKEGYGIQIQEKDNSREFFEIQPNRVSMGLEYFADMRFITDLFSGSESVTGYIAE